MSKTDRYYEENARKLAKNRAMKYQTLFEKENFENIMIAAEAKDIVKFTTACTSCKGIKLDPAEINWLWGYLQHSNEALWGPVKDVPAAYTGW